MYIYKFGMSSTSNHCLFSLWMAETSESPECSCVSIRFLERKLNMCSLQQSNICTEVRQFTVNMLIFYSYFNLLEDKNTIKSNLNNSTFIDVSTTCFFHDDVWVMENDDWKSWDRVLAMQKDTTLRVAFEWCRVCQVIKVSKFQRKQG